MKISSLIAACVFLSTGWTGLQERQGGIPSAKADHAIYIGVIQVLHDASAASAEVNVKVFTDDMQNALRNAFKNYEVIPEERICARQQELLAAYFAEHLTFDVNGTGVEMNLKSCTKENDVYWLTFDISCPPQWSKLRVEADFFMELFPTQSNMVSLHHGGERRFFRLTKGAAEQEIVF